MIDAGSACFMENKNLFSDPKETPEKFNLSSCKKLISQNKEFHYTEL